MKTFGILFFGLATISAWAQNATVTFRDSTTKQILIAATSDHSVITSNESLSFGNILAIDFERRVAVDEAFYRRLAGAGIAVYFAGTRADDIVPSEYQPPQIPVQSGKSPNAIYVNDTDINTLDIEFIMVMGMPTLSTKVAIFLDYGQRAPTFSGQRIRDQDGKVQKFFSMIESLNFLYKRGWDFVDAYPMTTGNDTTYHYLLRRKK